jgi:hypothetical protein
VTNTPQHMMAALRSDEKLRSQTYQASLGTVLLVVGILVPELHRYPLYVTLPVGLFVDAIGIVFVVLVVVRGIRLIRARELVTVARVTIAVIVIVPLIVLAITLSIHG